MNVLSLFDGMSCGQIALERAGIEYDNYFASEIDGHTIKVAMSNYPKTIQIGDVENWRNWDIDFSKIDLIMAGFPCQAWSLGGQKNGIEDPRGRLALVLSDVFEHVKSLNPAVKFIFENVKMKKSDKDFIDALFGIPSQEIDSIDFCPQSRKRNYWTNIKVAPIKRIKTSLREIIDNDKERYQWIDPDRANYILLLASLDAKTRKKVVKDGCEIPQGARITAKDGQFIYNNHLGQNGTILKDYAATIVCAGSHHITGYRGDRLSVRKMTISEYEKLQTLPVGYTSMVSESQARKMIGNGWTVDVIAHILKQLK